MSNAIYSETYNYIRVFKLRSGQNEHKCLEIPNGEKTKIISEKQCLKFKTGFFKNNMDILLKRELNCRGTRVAISRSVLYNKAFRVV